MPYEQDPFADMDFKGSQENQGLAGQGIKIKDMRSFQQPQEQRPQQQQHKQIHQYPYPEQQNKKQKKQKKTKKQKTPTTSNMGLGQRIKLFFRTNTFSTVADSVVKWLDAHWPVAIAITVIIIAIGFFSSRYIPVICGIGYVFIGWLAGRRNADMLSFVLYGCAIASLLIPYIIN